MSDIKQVTIGRLMMGLEMIEEAFDRWDNELLHLPAADFESLPVDAAIDRISSKCYWIRLYLTQMEDYTNDHKKHIREVDSSKDEGHNESATPDDPAQDAKQAQ